MINTESEVPEIVRYEFIPKEGPRHSFEVHLNRKSNYVILDPSLPAWTHLGVHQCHVCPIKGAAHCPAARDTHEILEVFSAVLSVDLMETRVHAKGRTYIKQTDAQTALRSLLGVVMASSACPILSRMKGLAFYHLPFSGCDETVYRAISCYLLRQYFVMVDGGTPDWQLVDLAKHYEHLQDLNKWFCARIRDASIQDANMNAIVSFFYLSAHIATSLEKHLETFRKQFL